MTLAAKAFLDALTNAVKTLALLYAATPYEAARAHLETYVRSIEPAVIDAIGPEKAPAILDALRRATMTEKRRLEASGVSRA